MVTGECRLVSAAASGIVEEIQQKATWSSICTALWPLYLPDNFEDQDSMTTPMRTFLSMAEHFRAAVLNKKTPQWKAHLPVTPCTTEELKQLLGREFQKDEREVLQQLAKIGSLSAAIIIKMQLTRAIVAEAIHNLRDERRVQSNLLEILSAGRFKVPTKQGLMSTHCPLKACRQQDSFDHMLKCYDLEDGLRSGPAATDFLVKMARKTQILDKTSKRVFCECVEENKTENEAHMK